MPLNALEHLSEKEIKELIERFYSGESATKLIKEYNLVVAESHLYREFPPFVTNEICSFCGTKLVQPYLPKSAAKFGYNKKDMYCPNCSHKPFASDCKCEACLERVRVAHELRVKQIQDYYSAGDPCVDFHELPFDAKVYLGALCRALCMEDLYTIKPYLGSNVVLAPTNALCIEIFDYLYRLTAIDVSPLSPITTFVLDDEFPANYYPDQVTYRLNLVMPTDKQELFNEILNPRYYGQDYREDALRLWKKIAIAECIEYLLFQMHRVNFSFSPGEKTHKVFEILLNDFSVSQIYSIIWKATAEASRFYLEKKVPKKHAANYVISACQRIGEQARLHGWTLSKYRRIPDLPQSALSALFFNRVLGIGDAGFNEPPQLL